MSFARAAYDECEYKATLISSVGPGKYQLTTPKADPCFQTPETGAAAGGGSRYDKAALIDVDSELIGIAQQYTRCRHPFKDVVHQQELEFPACKFEQNTEASRISNPPYTLREQGVNRFEHLCFDPQGHTEFQGHRWVHNRILVKDNHRPCIELPADQLQAFPSTNDSSDPTYLPNDVSTTRDQQPTMRNYDSIILAQCPNRVS
jgi:hypothetical protein